MSKIEGNILNVESGCISMTFDKLESQICDYIPTPLLQGIDLQKVLFYNDKAMMMEQCVQSLFDNSNNQLKQYGSANELCAGLKAYINFPLRRKRFQSRALIIEHAGMGRKRLQFDVMFDIPQLQCTKGEKFYRKFDFLMNFNTRLLCKMVLTNLELPPNQIALMKKCEERFHGSNEFIRCDSKVFDEMKEKMKQLMDNHCAADDAVQLETVHHVFRSIMAQVNPNPLPRVPSNICDAELIQGLIDSYPEVFLPYSKDKPPIVRLFVDDGQKFVMESELFDNRVMQQLKTDEKSLYAMDYKDILEKFPVESEKSSFIPVQVRRAQFAAVPIVTNSGEHCILASDALLEILHRIIAVFKVFHKNCNWNEVNKFMNILEEAFVDSKKDCRFFMNLKELDELKKRTDDYWSRSVKKIKCRDVGRYGFDFDFFTAELEYLELTKSFPDIHRFAKSVYNHVIDTQMDQFSRTCDLMNAVEKCQLICLLIKYPKLSAFMHSQNACHRVLHCTICPISTKDFKNSQWNEYPKDALVKVSQTDECAATSNWTMSAPDQTTLLSNYRFMTDEEVLAPHTKFFFLDMRDVKWAVETKKSARFALKKEAKMDEFLTSLDCFSKAMSNKKIYIRVVERNRVFADELLEIIEILLRRQNLPIGDRLDTYREAWKPQEPYIYSTIDVAEMKTVLEEFNIDKSAITTVNDAYFVVAYTTHAPTTNIVFTLASDGQPIIHRDQIVYQIFRRFVCGVNWNMDYCKTHSNCREDLKREVIRVMREYAALDDKTYASFDHYNKSITKLKDHCTIKHLLTTKKPSFENPTWTPMSAIPNSLCQSNLASFGLEWRFDGASESKVYVWNYRLEYVALWCDAFFKNENTDLVVIVRSECVSHLPPEMNKTETEWAREVYGINIKKLEPKENESVESEAVKKETNFIEKEIATLKKTIAQNKNEKKRLEEENTILKNRIQNQNGEIGDLKKIIAQNAEEKKNMRNSELEEEIKKKNERNIQLEKQIEQLKMRNVENKKKYEEEIKQLKLTASKSADDIVKLETRIKRKEAMEIQVKKSNDGRLRKLREEIAQIKEKSDSEQMKLVMRQSEMEEEIKRFQNSKESEDLEIQEKISAIHNMLDSIPSSKKLKNAEKSIKREASLKLAKEMVQRLSSTSPEFQQIADYEYEQFEAKMQNSESIPSFSEKFLDLYWENVINNRLSDSECLICLENIISTQKTLKCECCKKVFHFECASTWHSVRQSCAHCRRQQLNPEEFPSLA